MVVVILVVLACLLAVSYASMCFGSIVFYAIIAVGAVILLLALFLFLISRAIMCAIVRTIL